MLTRWALLALFGFILFLLRRGLILSSLMVAVLNYGAW